MKQTLDIEYQCQLRASLNENGDFSVGLAGNAIYDPISGASTSARIDLPEIVREQIKGFMQGVIDEFGPQLGQRVADAVHIHRQVASTLGEM